MSRVLTLSWVAVECLAITLAHAKMLSYDGVVAAVGDLPEAAFREMIRSLPWVEAALARQAGGPVDDCREAEDDGDEAGGGAHDGIVSTSRGRGGRVAWTAGSWRCARPTLTRPGVHGL